MEHTTHSGCDSYKHGIPVLKLSEITDAFSAFNLFRTAKCIDIGLDYHEND